MGDVDVTIELDYSTWEDLVCDQLLLKHLHMGGVDNWDWYSEAYREYEKELRSMGLLHRLDEDDDDE